MKNDFSVVKQENNFHLFESGEIGKGITKLLLSSFAPWLAKQEGKAKCIAAQYDNDAKDIADRRKQWKDGVLIPTQDVSNLGDLCKVMVHNESDYKAKCLERTLLVAASIIRNIPDESISDEPVNQTFLNHWREEAELIDDDDLRELWANLLVEETCKPNSISPRTLSVVKNLSRQDAEAFERLCQLIVFSNTILLDYNGLPLDGSNDDIFLLLDAGLLNQATKRIVENSRKNDDISVLSFGNGRFFLRIPSSSVFVHGHTLTTAGSQIVKYVKNGIDLNGVKRVAKCLSMQNGKEKVSLIQREEGISDSDALELWNTTQEI